MAPPNTARLPVAANAWHGGIKFPQLVQGELPSGGGEGSAVQTVDTTTALGFRVRYQIHPHFASGESQEVVYYHAYNPDMDRDDYVVSPEALDAFIDNAAMMAGFADNWYAFSASSDYTVESAKVVDKMMDGDFSGAVQAFGRSWWQAIKDPNWWFQTVTAVAAGAGKAPRPGARPFAARGVAGRSLTPLEMATHLNTTWEANGLLERTAQANQLARSAPPVVVHRELIGVLEQFEKDTGVAVQVVPEGTVQGIRGKGNLASLSTRPGVLQIEEQVFRSTTQLQNEIEHELAAHYAGAPPNHNIPRLGSSPFFAHELLEMMFETDGRLPEFLPKPPRGNIARFVAALSANRLRYPPGNDQQTDDLLLALQGALGSVTADASDAFGGLLQRLGTAGPQPGPGPGKGPPTGLSANARKVLKAMGPGTPELSMRQIQQRSGLWQVPAMAALLELSDAGLVILVYESGDRKNIISRAWKTRP
jgi:hypothetical protein